MIKDIMLQTTPQTEPTAIARRPDTAGPLAVATPTARKLADASISVNTRRAYLGAVFEAGRAPATDALAVAAVRFRAKLAGQTDPAGEATARVLGGYRRTAADRGRGQAAPLSADGLAAILATAERPRTDGRGVESHTTAQRRGRTDAVIAGLLFMGGLRRSVEIFVQCAYEYVQEMGFEEARRAFNEDERWKSGPTYVFVDEMTPVPGASRAFVYSPDPSREGMPWGELVDAAFWTWLSLGRDQWRGYGAL